MNTLTPYIMGLTTNALGTFMRRVRSEVFEPNEKLRAGGRDHLDRSQLHIVRGLRYALVLRRLASGDGRAGDLDLVADVGRQTNG